MDYFIELIHQGGPGMYLLIGLTIIGLPLSMVLGVLSIVKWRVPAFTYVGLPLLVLSLGAGLTVQGMLYANEALVFASLDTLSTLAHAGFSTSLVSLGGGALAAGALLTLGAMAGALGNLAGVGRDARLDLLPSLASGGLLLMGGLALLGWSLLSSATGIGVGIGMIMLSPVLLLAALRRSEDDAVQSRLAEGRASVALCVIGAIACVALWSTVEGLIILHSALGYSSSEGRAAVFAMGGALHATTLQIGIVGVLTASLSGLLSWTTVMRSLTARRTLVSLGLTALGLLLFTGILAMLSMQYDVLKQNWPEVRLASLDSAIDLPEPVLLNGIEAEYAQLPAFSQLVTRSDAGWSSQERGGALASLSPDSCTDGRLLVAVSSSTPAQELAQTPWNATPCPLLLLARSTLLTESGDPFQDVLAYHALPFLWIPPETDTGPEDAPEPEEASAPEDGMDALLDMLTDSDEMFKIPQLDSVYEDNATLIVTESDAGVTLYHRGTAQPAPDLTEAIASARSLADTLGEDDFLTLAFAPGPSWTTQQLVSACAGFQGPQLTDEDSPLSCALLSGFDASRLQRRSPQEAPERDAMISQGDVTLIGSLEKAQISDVLQDNISPIRLCYERALMSNPALSGALTVKFVIARDGSVSTASVRTSTLGDSTIERCITDRIRTLQFPQPNGGGIVIVTYPFVFTPG